jgi:hypothetical protein
MNLGNSGLKKFCKFGYLVKFILFQTVLVSDVLLIAALLAIDVSHNLIRF